jgi:hypothetical protein
VNDDATIRGLAEKVTGAVRAEPRKAGALALLLIVLGVLWAKVFVLAHSAPSAAEATTQDVPRTEVKDLVPRAQASAASRSLIEWTKQPVPPGSKNLFSIDFEQFRRDAAKVPSTPLTGTDGFWDQMEKSLAIRADQEKARGLLLEDVRNRATRLKLHSTVMNSGHPKALVNGTLLSEGDMIEGFKVIRIEAHRIMVEREGVRLEVFYRF